MLEFFMCYSISYPKVIHAPEFIVSFSISKSLYDLDVLVSINNEIISLYYSLQAFYLTGKALFSTHSIMSHLSF